MQYTYILQVPSIALLFLLADCDSDSNISLCYYATNKKTEKKKNYYQTVNTLLL